MNDRRTLDLPDRRQHTYAALEERLDKHVTSIEDRLRGFFAKALAAFAVIGLASAIALFGFGFVLKTESGLTEDIQQERYETILQNCLDQNNRNLEVNRRIDAVVNAIPSGPRRERAERSRGPFKLIIGAAVPFTSDCVAHTKERVTGDHE